MTTFPRQRDPEAVRSGLERWLRHSRPGASPVVAALSRPSSGLSGETWFVDVLSGAPEHGGVEELVARLAPAGDGVFPAYDLSRQARLQEKLASTAVPVARPVAFEPDPGWVGSEFLVLARVPGRVVGTTAYRKGWLHDATPAEQRLVHDSLLEVLALVHQVAWEPLGLSFLARGGPGATPGLRAEIDWWSWYLSWASEGNPLDVLVDAMDWCRVAKPEPEPPPSLLWGDVQLANAVFGDDLKPVAVLDWEMASIGPPEIDLGWHLALLAMAAEAAGADLAGFPGRESAVATYEAHLGRHVADLEWFETFALARSGAILARVAALLSASGVDDSWLTKGNPQVETLRRAMRRH